MARLPRITDADAPLGTRLVYRLARREMRKAAGGAPAGGLAPLELFAHLPGMLAAYGHVERATSRLDALDARHRSLAELRAATLVGCEYCLDIGSQIARRSGLGDAELLDLHRYRESDHFDAVDRLVLDYATAMSRTPADVSDALFARLREVFDAPQLVELTYVVALEHLRSRFNHALDLRAAGFSAGAACALPAVAGAGGVEAPVAGVAP